MDCKACSANTSKMLRYDAKNDFKIFKCQKCGAIFADIEDDKINRDENIQLNKISSNRFWINRKLYESTALWDYVYLKTHIDLKKVKTSVDIGAQFGFLVKKLSEVGIRSKGIEPLKLKGTVTDDIINTYFDLTYDEIQKYDLICLTNMIHYFPDSYIILNKCLRMLNENGFLFITSYSVDSSLIMEFVNRRERGPLLYLSRKNYEDYCNKNNVSLIDYSTFYSKLFLSRVNKKTKLIILIRFFLYQFKILKPFKRNPDGERNYIILQKSNIPKV